MSSTFDAESAGNAQEVEMQFAVKTVEHLEAYENLIASLPPSKLRLTPIDDELHVHLITDFPEYKFDDALRVLDEDAMKSTTGKERWRNLILAYEKRLTDYNFGTLIRRDCEKAYAEDNTVLVTRVQFFALEIARNRAGLNDKFHAAAQAEKAKSS